MQTKNKYYKKINFSSKHLSFLRENKHISFLLAIIISFIFGHLLIDYFKINKSFLAFETNNLQNIILGILTVYIPFILLFLTNIKKKIKFDALILLKDIKNIFVVSVVYLLIFSFKFNAFINACCLISLILACYKFYYPEFEKLLQYARQNDFSFEVRQKYFQQLINNKNIIDLEKSWQLFWQKTKNEREDEYYDLFYQTIKLFLTAKADNGKADDYIIYKLCSSYYENREKRKNNPYNSFNLQFFNFINEVINNEVINVDRFEFQLYLLLYSVLDRLLTYEYIKETTSTHDINVFLSDSRFIENVKKIKMNKNLYRFLKYYLQGCIPENQSFYKRKKPDKSYCQDEDRKILNKVIEYFFLDHVNSKGEEVIKNFDAENFDDTLFYQVLEQIFDIKILTEDERKIIIYHYSAQSCKDYQEKLKKHFDSMIIL